MPREWQKHNSPIIEDVNLVVDLDYWHRMFPVAAEVSHFLHIGAPRPRKLILMNVNCRFGEELIAATMIAMQVGVHDDVYVSRRQVYPAQLTNNVFVASHDRND